jgi:hypothetical protein
MSIINNQTETHCIKNVLFISTDENCANKKYVKYNNSSKKSENRRSNSSILNKPLVKSA